MSLDDFRKVTGRGRVRLDMEMLELPLCAVLMALIFAIMFGALAAEDNRRAAGGRS